jgi:ATP-dependent RNA helicase DHX8/PRP22
MKDPRRIAPIPTGAPSASGDRATGGANLGARASSHVARHDEKVGPDAEKNADAADAADAAAARRARKLVLQRVRDSLPIAASRDRLIAEIRARETLIVVGETGSGKTTQLPQYAHEAGLAGGLAVACTQPRRVAAVSVARRVAEETGTVLGDLVGYAIRFEDVSSNSTRVKFLTDGMLLREATADANLERYGVVMIDEAHERTLQTDFLLGVLKKTQERRRLSKKPLKLVIMSATLEADSFSKFFGNAPVVYSRGRKFPVETFYTEEPEDDYLDAALCAVCQINESEPEGDVLVFLTGQEEIESLGRLLRARAGARAPENAVNEEGEKETTKKRASSRVPALHVAPLFAAMPPEEQMRAFEPAPPGARKVVLATNIAETSLTINGIRYVVDTGLTKRRVYHPRSGVDELVVAPIAVSQATQRAGRAGREGPGKCFRLYCEDVMRILEPHVTPELLRTNLSGVVLQLKAMGVDDILSFPFIDPPPREALVRSLELLYALGALGGDGRLNAVGRKMSRFPLEPMAARAILAGHDEACAEDVIAVVSMLTTDNVFRERAKESPGGAGGSREKNPGREQYAREEGDHATLLAVFRAFSKCGAKRRKEFCATNAVHLRSMTKARDIFEQLARAAQSEGVALTSKGDETAPVLRALVAGFFLNVARRQVDGSFKTVSTGQRLGIHPSSVLFQRPPEMILFNELVKTNRLYARDVSAVAPEWLAEMSPRVYSARKKTDEAR